MFRGYPQVGLAPLVELDLTFEKTNPEGAVKGVQQPPIEQVVISMSTALRIAKIARDATSTLAISGTLCGLQIGSTMEVTFAHPHRKVQKKDEKEKEKKDKPYDEKEDPMHLAPVIKELFSNEEVDVNVVGQFVAGSLCSKAMLEMRPTLENLLKCQSSGAAAILLCYDPLAASELGKLNFTAYTLTNEFNQIAEELSSKNAKEGDFLGHNKFADLVQQSKLHETGIFNAVPVDIQCSALHKMMLHQLEVAPLPTSRDVATSIFTEQYLEELLFKMSMTCDQLKNSMFKQNSGGKNEEQKLTQILHMDQLKRQTTQLIGLCDSIILHTAITDKISGKTEA